MSFSIAIVSLALAMAEAVHASGHVTAGPGAAPVPSEPPTYRCPLPLIALRRESAGVVRSAPRDITDPAVCGRALALSALVDRMRPGAMRLAEQQAREEDRVPAFALNDVFLAFLEDDDTVNAHYWWNDRVISVTRGFLDHTSSDEEAASIVLGHELAHAVQLSLGSNPSECDATHESQADAWGLEIVRRAGLPTDQAHVARVRLDGDHEVRRGGQVRCATHPNAQIRYVNALVAKAAGQDSSGVAGKARQAASGAADLVFDGGAPRGIAPDPSSSAATPAAAQAPAATLLRRSDFTIQGQLVTTVSVPPPAAAGRDGETTEPPASEALRLAVYELGNRSGWTHPVVGRIIAFTAGAKPRTLDEAIRAAIGRLGTDADRWDAFRRMKELYRGHAGDERN